MVSGIEVFPIRQPKEDIGEPDIWSDDGGWTNMQRLTLRVVLEALMSQPQKAEEKWRGDFKRKWRLSIGPPIGEGATFRRALEKMKFIMAVNWPLAFNKEDKQEELRPQTDFNNIEPTPIPAGKLTRAEPRKSGVSEKYLSNPLRAKNAIWNANFKCEINSEHTTFVNKKTRKQYVEAHHLIPMSKQWAFEFDIYVPEIFYVYVLPVIDRFILQMMIKNEKFCSKHSIEKKMPFPKGAYKLILKHCVLFIYAKNT